MGTKKNTLKVKFTQDELAYQAHLSDTSILPPPKYLEQPEERPAYTPPTTKLIPISTTILNNSSGGGDGDSALAHS